MYLAILPGSRVGFFRKHWNWISQEKSKTYDLGIWQAVLVGPNREYNQGKGRISLRNEWIGEDEVKGHVSETVRNRHEVPSGSYRT